MEAPKADPPTGAAGPKASADATKRAKAIELASFMVLFGIPDVELCFTEIFRRFRFSKKNTDGRDFDADVFEVTNEERKHHARWNHVRVDCDWGKKILL